MATYEALLERLHRRERCVARDEGVGDGVFGDSGRDTFRWTEGGFVVL